MRAHHLAISLACATLATACNDHPVQPLDAVLTAVNRQENRLPAKTKIDLLVVIDNSGSMCEEQTELANNFDLFANFLSEDLGEAADYRIAVVTTDMSVGNCDRGRFVTKPGPRAPNCDVAQMNACEFREPILKSGVGGNIVDGDDLKNKFACIVSAGTGGSTTERGLGAIRSALSCGGPNKAYFDPCCVGDDYNPGCRPEAEGKPEPEFLRPDALLIIIIVSDEDDCSDKAGEALTACPPHAECSNYVEGAPVEECFERMLAGLPDDQAVKRPDFSKPRTDSDLRNYPADENDCDFDRDHLTPVDEYISFVRKLKASPEKQIVVASLVGPRLYTPSGQRVTFVESDDEDDRAPECRDRINLNDANFGGENISFSSLSIAERTAAILEERERVTTGVCCPEGVCVGDPPYSCYSSQGEAKAGNRYLEFAEAFEKNGVGCSEVETPTAAQLAPCAPGGDSAPLTERECVYVESEVEITGKCRPVSGTAQYACVRCISICSDSFEKPLAAIKDRVAKLVGSYCLDQMPACQVNDGASVRECETLEELIPANYASQIRVEMSCTRTAAEGGVCEENIAPKLLPPTEWSLNLEATECGGGPRLALNDPPPAGAEVILEFIVAIGGATSSGEAPAPGPGPAGDAGPANNAAPDASP
jgi:hypothetical protein